MGVHGLWDLLSPVGRRVSVETLAGKRLAIDASIWMIQFMKAMRDEKGEMVRNAHLIGFFRRICKLLFLRTKPVFVFDGATPALKRRTVVARRRQRENAQAKIRKTAEKLLINHLKAMRLKNLAEDLKEQRVNHDKGKEAVSNQSKPLAKNNDMPKAHNQEMIDEMLVASILAEESGGLDGEASTSGGAINGKSDCASTSGATFLTEDEDDEDDEEMILPIPNGNVDPAVLASLPPSMQLDLLVQMRERLMAENRQKYQKVKKAPQRFSELQIESYLKTVAFRREIDQVQKAAAGKGVAGVQTSRIASEANREFIFSSSFSGDKQLLASGGAEKNLGRPQSTQKTDASLDILNVIASATKSNPVARVTADEPSGDFGNEVETFLDERGRMRVSRRRAMGVRMTGDLERNIHLIKELEKETGFSRLDNAEIEIDKEKDPSGKSHCGGQSSKSVSVDGDNVEDNIEKSLLQTESNDNEVAPGSQTGISISINDDGEDGPLDADDEFFSRLVSGNQVSICSTDNSTSDCEWEEGTVFKQTGDLGDKNKLETNSSHAQDGNSESDVEWEDGTSALDNNSKVKSFCVEDSQHNENRLECREGTGDLCEYDSEIATGSQKAASKGFVEEEAAVQEAIRRSLEDLIGRKASNISSEMDKSDYVSKTSLQWESRIPEPSSKLGNVLHDNGISPALASQNNGTSVATGKGNCAATSAGMHSGSARAVTAFEETETAAATSTSKEGAQIMNMGNNDTYVPTHVPGGGSLQVNSVNDAAQIEAASRHFSGEVSCSATGRAASALVEHELHTDVKEAVGATATDTLKVSARIDNGENNGAYVPGHISGADPLCVTSADGITKSEEAAYTRNSCEVYDSSKERTESVMGEQESHTDVQKNMAKEDVFPAGLQEQGSDVGVSAQDDFIEQDIFPAGLQEQSSDVGVSSQDDFTELVGAGLEDELSALGQEYKNLGDMQRKLERNADSVNAEMFVECQELLQMFGLPYIIAPMEAEAQCAYMELANLVDGVVTDDSDVFLFGARSVYKNIFDDRKYVETYFMKDIESELGLNREKLIRMAMLLGSDYTEGVSGIGIVNAIEVVNAFPEEDGLRKFREWVESPDPTILGKIGVQPGSSSKKRGAKAFKSGKSDYTSDKEGTSISDRDALHENEDNQALDDTSKLKQAFMDTHRNVSKNWHIPGSFPSDAVISAYTAPQVDKSTEPFSWGKPDIFLLRKICWEKFGWASQKADELLLPVLKEYNKHETQLRLEAFYTFNERFAKIRSKRIKKAVKGITGKRSSELPSADDSNEVPERAKRRKVSSKDSIIKDKELMNSNAGDGEMINSTKKLNSQRKRSDQKQALNNAGSSRVRGQRKGKGVQVGMRKDDSDSEIDETNVHLSSSSGSGTEYEDEIHAEKVHTSDIVRRSKRARKDVNYADSDEENERNVSPNRGSQNCSIDKAAKDFQCENVATVSGLGGDYLVEGGGFCAEEEDRPQIEIDQVASLQNNPTSFEADKEYLQMGGGFCVDEDEENQEENQSVLDPTHQSDLPISTPPQSTLDSQALPGAQESNPCDQNNTNVSTNVESNENEAPSNVSAFSAIPFLRRKRRRN